MPPRRKNTTSSKPLSKAQYDALVRSITKQVAGRTHKAPIQSRAARNYTSRSYVPYMRKYGAAAYRYASKGASYASRFLRGGNVNPRYTNITPGMARHFGVSAHECVIEYREYIGDIISAGVANTFRIQGFPINPGMPVSFPWLSQVAQNYEMYRLEKCAYEYRTFSSDALNSTNTALGSVIVAVEYDSTDNPYQNRQQMENSAYAMSAKPSESFSVPVDTRASQSFSGNKLYIRTINNPWFNNNTPTYGDLKTYDVGTLYIATTGFQGTSVNCGSLYVSYRVRLFKPVMNNPGMSVLTCIAYPQTLASVSATDLFGSALVSTADNIGIVQSGNVITIPANTIPLNTCLFFEWYCVGVNTASVNPPAAPTLVGFTTLSEYYGNWFLSQPSPAAATSDTCRCSGFIQYIGTNGAASAATITFSSTSVALPSSISAAGFNMTQLNANLV